MKSVIGDRGINHNIGMENIRENDQKDPVHSGILNASGENEADVDKKMTVKRQFSADIDDSSLPELEPQKKLCRFYYLDNCTTEEKCKYMHADFPCKYYYFGFECRDGFRCKLRHGPALQQDMQEALWEHVTSAPANLLQRFPSFPHALLKKNFEERNDELLQMEQEGLIDGVEEAPDKPVAKDLSDDLSSTLLSEAIKTFNRTNKQEEALVHQSELKEALTHEQIVSLANVGVRTKEDLFMLGATSFLELGFEYETIIHIGNLKEAHRRQSHYIENDEDINVNSCAKNTNSDVFELESPDKVVSISEDEHILTDQELLNILNDGLKGSTASTITETATCDDTITSISETDTSYDNCVIKDDDQKVVNTCSLNQNLLNNELRGSTASTITETAVKGDTITSIKNTDTNQENCFDCLSKDNDQKVVNNSNNGIGNLLNLGYSLSQLEVLEKENGLQFVAKSSSQPDNVDDSSSPILSQADNVAPLNAFKSDISNQLELMLYPLAEQKESDRLVHESIQRTVEQVQKINSLLSEPKEQDIEWASEESDISFDNLKQDSSVTDSANQSYGSDSDSQTIFRMPFKSIIDQYTPATEIDGSNGKYPTVSFKLIPIDIPQPNFDRVRQSFVIEPTHSLDPRIQLMFNIGPTEPRHIEHTKVIARDPRLNKQVSA
ncbi:uncharacterized protein LOC131682490 [Topomyia yanbarensis]|uniref:uncharacterized protein LOC131682490 n=1 Tax=Topomyia yanbarensis TaxID=2498891 RepID=UPI00273B4115|nr:uncharacterized protein LOC131682490 [Topomyia yanbarensis]